MTGARSKSAKKTRELDAVSVDQSNGAVLDLYSHIMAQDRRAADAMDSVLKKHLTGI